MISTINTQLAVIGGGPAGICAAISAARQGIRTVLICDRPVLGGNSSSEFRVWTRGAVGAGNLFAEEMGIWGELKLLNLYRNPDANPVFWDEVLLDAALGEKNLKLFLNTVMFSVKTEGRRITAIRGIQSGTEKEIELVPEVCIDASGDGSIAEKAGMRYVVGRPEGTLGSSILYYSRKEDHPVKFVPPDYALGMDEIEQLINRGGRIVSERMSGCDCWWFEYGGTRDTIHDEQEITVKLKRLVLGVWNYIKNSGKYNAADYTLEWIGNMAGKRESRRMETAYRLSGADIRSGKEFYDAAFYGGWYIDYHPPGGIQDADSENCIQKPVNVYQIPLRCLYGDFDNLIVAGRMIGTDSEAFFSSRVMNTCALSGQAAGTLAAACIAEGKRLPGLGETADRHIRVRLQRDDMFVPGQQEPDPDDIANRASVSAGSVSDGMPGAVQSELSLEKGGFAVIPGRHGSALIRVRSDREGVLEAACSGTPLPNRYLPGNVSGRYRWNLVRGENELRMQVPEAAEGHFCMIRFQPCGGAGLLCCRKERTGFLCGEEDSSDYREPCISYEPETAAGLYRPEQTVNGYTRPWNGPNAWLPADGDGDPCITLSWEKAEAVREVRIYLDPDLSMELVNSRAASWNENHRYTRRSGMPPQLARRILVSADTADGGTVSLFQKENNCKRLLVIPVAIPEKIVRIRVEIPETWGNVRPVIYEIRVLRPGVCN